VCIPFTAGKQTHGHSSSREPVVKMETTEQWQYLETREETLDRFKVRLSFDKILTITNWISYVCVLLMIICNQLKSLAG